MKGLLLFCLFILIAGGAGAATTTASVDITPFLNISGDGVKNYIYAGENPPWVPEKYCGTFTVPGTINAGEVVITEDDIDFGGGSVVVCNGPFEPNVGFVPYLTFSLENALEVARSEGKYIPRCDEGEVCTYTVRIGMRDAVPEEFFRAHTNENAPRGGVSINGTTPEEFRVPRKWRLVVVRATSESLTVSVGDLNNNAGGYSPPDLIEQGTLEAGGSGGVMMIARYAQLTITVEKKPEPTPEPIEPTPTPTPTVTVETPEGRLVANIGGGSMGMMLLPLLLVGNIFRRRGAATLLAALVSLVGAAGTMHADEAAAIKLYANGGIGVGYTRPRVEEANGRFFEINGSEPNGHLLPAWTLGAGIKMGELGKAWRAGVRYSDLGANCADAGCVNYGLWTLHVGKELGQWRISAGVTRWQSGEVLGGVADTANPDLKDGSYSPFVGISYAFGKEGPVTLGVSGQYHALDASGAYLTAEVSSGETREPTPVTPAPAPAPAAVPAPQPTPPAIVEAPEELRIFFGVESAQIAPEDIEEMRRLFDGADEVVIKCTSSRFWRSAKTEKEMYGNNFALSDKRCGAVADALVGVVPKVRLIPRGAKDLPFAPPTSQKNQSAHIMEETVHSE